MREFKEEIVDEEFFLGYLIAEAEHFIEQAMVERDWLVTFSSSVKSHNLVL